MKLVLSDGTQRHDQGLLLFTPCVMKRDILVTASSYKNVRAFVDKLFRRGKANAAIAASNERDFSFKLTHIVLLSCHLFAIAGCRSFAPKTKRPARQQTPGRLSIGP